MTDIHLMKVNFSVLRHIPSYMLSSFLIWLSLAFSMSSLWKYVTNPEICLCQFAAFVDAIEKCN